MLKKQETPKKIPNVGNITQTFQVAKKTRSWIALAVALGPKLRPTGPNPKS